MSGGWPRLRFCESPDVESATRLDLHNAGVAFNGDVAALADGFSLGVPSVSSPASSRQLTLGTRSTRLPLRVAGTKMAAVTTLNQVARELMRPTNWLEVQIAPELEPRWLRTYASMPEPVDLSQVYDNPRRRDQWVTALPLTADPLAVGPLLQLGAWTVTNHPASGDHPMVVELPEIDGEAAAPLLVKVAKGATGGMLGPALGLARVAPVTVAAPDGWGAAVGAGVADAGMISGTRRPTSGGLAAWTAVATWAPDPAELPGGDDTRWAALLRVDGSTTAGVFRARWRIQADGMSSVVYSQPVVVGVSTQSRWVRVGEVPCPMLEPGAFGELGITAATTLTLEVQRIISGGELWFDAPLMLVPSGPGADLLLVSPDPVTTAVSVLVDADGRRAAVAAGVAPTRTPGVAGGWPHAVPGEPNHLLVMQSLDPTAAPAAGDAATSTAVVTVSYRPRYVWGV